MLSFPRLQKPIGSMLQATSPIAEYLCQTIRGQAMKHQRQIATRLALFAPALASVLALASAAPAQQVAFTWDDLPAHGQLPAGVTRVQVGKQLILAMQAAHLPPAWGFVNGIHTTEEPDSTPMLKDWRDAGFPLGNHTWSHPSLNRTPLADWEADLVKNEPLLESYMPANSWRWVRFPYLDEGDTPDKRAAARKFLAAHGYKIAGVTTSFGDYLFNGPYARCVEKTTLPPSLSSRRPTWTRPLTTSTSPARCLRPSSSATSPMCS
jgi:peptidoglycan/xylan/chitin deacetylase (PgdA/CDA1 family)